VSTETKPRPPTDGQVDRCDRAFLADVDTELCRARDGHAPINSAHEGYSVILEELDEFWEEVKRKRPDPGAMYAELVQVAAMAARTAVDCGLDRGSS
jgi:hypothetical protein